MGDGVRIVLTDGRIELFLQCREQWDWEGISSLPDIHEFLDLLLMIMRAE